MNVNELKAWLDSSSPDGPGDWPVNADQWGDGICSKCGNPIATDEAWEKLEEGQGTNLCFFPDECVSAESVLILTRHEVECLYHDIERLINDEIAD